MSFITEIDFERLVNHPISLPHTEIQAGETVVISTVLLQAGKMADLAWLNLHVPRVAPSIRSSRLTYAYQSGNTVTASDNFFLQEDVGAIIHWDDGTEDTIVKYNSPTSVNVTQNQTVAAGYFELFGSAPRLINSGMGTVYVGLYGEQFSRINLPTGNPLYYLALDSPGVTALPIRSRRILYGPDVISVAITNNTENVDIVEAVVTGCLRAYV